MNRSAVLVLVGLISPCAGQSQARVELPPATLIARTISVGESPLWAVGGMLDNPDREFDHRNGLLAAVASRSGRIAVLDGHRVHIFEPGGATHRIVGVRGAGPNEFTNIISGCFTRGDTLVTYDFALRRMSVLSPTGAIVRQFGVPQLAPVWNLACSDGTVLVQQAGVPRDGEMVGAVVRMDLEGRVVATITSMPTGVAALRTQLAARDVTTLVGDPRTNILREVDDAGGVTTTIKLGDAAEPMGRAEAVYAGLAPPRRADSRSAGAVTPTVWPFFGRVFVDFDQRIWIERFRRSPREDGRWMLLDRDAHPLATVVVPRQISGAVPAVVIGANASGVFLLRRDSDGAAEVTFHAFQERTRP